MRKSERRTKVRSKVFNFAEGEILNIYKPAGITSFRVVHVIRNLVGVKKVGHAGTLDPFADGVLLVCTGKATKKVSQLMNLQKEYIGNIKLGIETDTDDRTGKIINSHSVPELTLQEIEKNCQQFIGEIPQIPPMYSAKKIGGKRLYKIARQGQVVERRPAIVTIHSIDILDFHLPEITMKVTCSKGTYIRSLARDIGIQIGCGAYLHGLTRTKIGEHRIEDSITLERFKAHFEIN